MASTDPNRLLWAEEAAEFLGLASAHAVRCETSRTRAHIRTEGRARPGDFPLPAEEGVRREVPATRRVGGRKIADTRVVYSSRWRLGDLEDMQASRKRELRTRAASHRDPATGRLAAKAS